MIMIDTQLTTVSEDSTDVPVTTMEGFSYVYKTFTKRVKTTTSGYKYVGVTSEESAKAIAQSIIDACMYDDKTAWIYFNGAWRSASSRKCAANVTVTRSGCLWTINVAITRTETTIS